MTRSVLGQGIKKKLPFDSPEEEVFLNVMRTHSVLLAEAELLLKQFDITVPKYNVLRILRGAKKNGECDERGMPSLEVADRMITRVPDITRLVDGLEADGLVTRTRCEEDRRIVFVGITAEGMDLTTRIDEPLRAMHHEQMTRLTKEEMSELIRLLVKARKVPGT